MLLLITTTFSVVGCGGYGGLQEEFYDDGKPYNIVYYLYYNSADAPNEMSAVEDQINVLLQSCLPNTTITIVPYVASEYTTKVSGPIIAGTQFDICFTSPEINPYLPNVQREAFLPLDWLIDEYAPTTKASISENIMNATRYNGKSYGVVNEQIYPRTYSMRFRDSAVIAEFLSVAFPGENITTDTIYTKLNSQYTAFDFVRQFLRWCRENSKGHGGFIHQIDTSSTMQNMYGYDDLGTGMFVPGAVKLSSIKNENGKYSATVVNQFETADYEELLSFVYELADAGYLNPDKGETNYDVVAENNWKPGYRTGQTAKLGQPQYFTSYIIGSMNAISSTSKNPARAMKFLELLRTNSQIHNTLQFGIEGLHYVLDDNNPDKIARFTGTGYNNSQFGWGLGTEFISYLQPGQPDDLWQQVKDINAQTEMSPLIGFMFDSTPVKQKLADCRSVASEFVVSLQTARYDDMEQALSNFRSRLISAGANEVIAEKQRQLDAYFASK